MYYTESLVKLLYIIPNADDNVIKESTYCKKY